MEVFYRTLFQFVIVALYLTIGAIAYRWLIPRLTWAGKRVTSVFLIAQVVAISWSVVFPPSSSFEAWLWHLDREWNIPTTIASTQLALIGFTALLTAWHARSQPTWLRLYFAALGLMFVFLAYDEYSLLHEFLPYWLEIYILLGITVALVTLAVALKAQRQMRIWHFLLLAGLAISALGAIVTEAPEKFSISFVNYGDNRSWLEESLEFAGIWLVLVASFGHLSALSDRPAVRLRVYVGLVLLWLLFLSQSRAILPVEHYAGGSDSANVVYEDGYQLHGYLMENNKKHINLFLSPGRWDYLGHNLAGLGYSIHMVDQVSGESIISRDKGAHLRYFLLTPGYTPVYRQWVEMERPAEIVDNRAYWIVLTLWRDEADEFKPLKITSSDHQLLSDTQVVLSEKVWRDRRPDATRDPLAKFDNGFALDAWQAPESIRAGEPLKITFSWRSEAGGHEDHTQFLHLGHAESGEWWVYNQAPLGGRLPTRLWYSGLSDSETWNVPLPADLAPGRYQIFSGLYRTGDKERIPASDAEGDFFRDARVPLGSLVIE